MKLPDFLADARMNALRQKMGLNEDHFGSLGRISVMPDEVQTVTRTSNITLEDGTLSNGRQRIFIYIQDHAEFVGTPNPRIHFATCSTIDDMRSKNRFHKYVQVVPTKDQYRIRRTSSASATEMWLKLKVCQNCLHQVAFEGFHHGMPFGKLIAIVNNFSAERFFEMYHRDLFDDVPEHTWETSPLDTYTADMPKIAHDRKVAARWTCEDCKLSLASPEMRRYLWLHHDGLKWENDKTRVLCMECHAKQPNHEHLLAHPMFKQFLEMRNRRQPP